MKSKISLLMFIGIVSNFNAYCSSLDIDAASILSNMEYHEKLGVFSADFENRNKSDFSKCNNIFYRGKSPSVPNTINLKVTPLCFDGVAIAYSGTRKTPLYIAEVLNKSVSPKKNKLNIPDILMLDERLPKNERVSKTDYFNNIFSADSDEKINNGIPLAPEVIKKTWATYDNEVKKKVSQINGDVHVITGTVVSASSCGLSVVSQQLLEADYIYVPWGADKIIKKSMELKGMPARYNLSNCSFGKGIVVPSFVYRLVYSPVASQAWVYWFENTNTKKINAPISYAELMRRTGIDFFPGVKVI